MAFAADAIADVIAPPPARAASAPAEKDDGPSFQDQLDRHAEPDPAEPRPHARRVKEAPDTNSPEAVAQEQPASPAIQPPPQAAALAQILASLSGLTTTRVETPAASAPETPSDTTAKTDAPQIASPAIAQQAAPAPCAPDAPAQVRPEPTKPVQAKEAAAPKHAPSAADAETPKQAAPQTPTPASEATQATAPVQQTPIVTDPSLAASVAPIPIGIPATSPSQPAQQRAATTGRTDATASAPPDIAAQLLQSDTTPRPVRPVGPQQAQSRDVKDSFAAKLANANAAADTGAAPQPGASEAPARAPALPLVGSTHASQGSNDLALANATRAAPVAAQVGHEIVRRFNGETTRFELRLDPPELGRVDVRLEVSRDHRVTAIISADNPQALSDLSRAARDLQQSLQSAGLQLADNGLSFDLANRGDSFAQAQADRNNAPQRAGGEVIDEPTAVARPRLERWQGGRLDVIV